MRGRSRDACRELSDDMPTSTEFTVGRYFSFPLTGTAAYYCSVWTGLPRFRHRIHGAGQFQIYLQQRGLGADQRQARAGYRGHRRSVTAVRFFELGKRAR
jgi:hypothetical protein